jgi:DNA-binding MurR/RpiR family transcriptional regulator
MQDLRPAERRVARALLADYPSAGLGTISDLARRVGVSPPSVLRFAQGLGFEGYAALQTSLREELTARSHGPLGRIKWDTEKGSTSELLVRRAGELTETAKHSLGAIPPADLDTTVQLLADSSRRLFLAGGRFSRLVAEYLAMSLEQIRPNVYLIQEPLGRDLGHLVDLSKRDVRRYQRTTIELARQVRARRTTIILITDRQLSPAAADAHVVLPVSVDSPSPFDSMVSALVLAELLVIPVLNMVGHTGQERMTEWENLRGPEVRP